MDINAKIDFRIHREGDDELRKSLEKLFQVIHQLKEITMATAAELVTQINSIGASITKTIGEIATLQATITSLNDQIVVLQDAVAKGGNSTPEVDAALANVAALAKQADDEIPDVPPVPVPTPAP